MTSSRAGEENTTMSRPDQTSRPAGEDQQTETKASTSRPRLKKDGTPDRRGGKLGNAGNKYATGRKAIPGYDVRKNYNYVATAEENELLKVYNNILRGNPKKAALILASLGTPPGGRAKNDERKHYSIKCNDQEKQILKAMLAIIKDRYIAASNLIRAGE
jgi:hypothetical protein